MHTQPDYKTRWMFHSESSEVVEVPVSGSIVISSTTALRDAMLAGLGVALLPTWLVKREIETGRAIDLFPNHVVTGASKESGVWLLYTSRQFIPAKVRNAIDFFRSSFHENG